MYFELMKSFQDIVCEKIIRDVSKSIKNVINEAFDFGSVDNSSVKRVKILSDIAKEEAKWVELENSDIVKVLEGLYGITRPRGFKVGKEVAPNNEKKRELQKIEDKIFCIDCKEKVREAIFAECSHLLLCKDCLPKHYIRGNKKKAQCPMCNQVSKRIFDVKYDNDDQDGK